MEVGSCVKCAETFSACGCGSKAAERYEAYEDPISDRQEYKIDELGGKVDKSMTRSEASDYIKELQGRESGTWKAESSPLPPDPRVSPLNEGLYTPSDTPEMAAEMKESFAVENADEVLDDLEDFIGAIAHPENLDDDLRLHNIVKFVWYVYGQEPLNGDDIDDITQALKEWNGEDDESFGAEGKRNPYRTWPSPKGRYKYKELTLENLDKDDLLHMIGEASDITTYGGDKEDLLEEGFDEDYIGTIGGYFQRRIDGANISRQKNPSAYKDQKRKWWDWKAESFGAESKFDKLAKEIAEEYEEKGKSPKEAMEIGEATAAKIGRAKFGKKKFAKMGQKAEDDIDFDKSKADRNKDGRISDWERAVGNAVAKGIRDHKGAESAFDRLEDEVADEYEEKGMSDKEAKRIGAAVAYEQGVKKYGKKIMSEAARKGVSAQYLLVMAML